MDTTRVTGGRLTSWVPAFCLPFLSSFSESWTQLAHLLLTSLTLLILLQILQRNKYLSMAETDHQQMAQGIPVRRVSQYSLNGSLFIRTVGAKDWEFPRHYDTNADYSARPNVFKPTFTPGNITVIQQAEQPQYDSKSTLVGNLYMWKSIFSVADLHDICVKEVQGDINANPKIRIEIRAICKSRPIGHGLVAQAGVRQDQLLFSAKETSDPIASSLELAKLPGRWDSGDQEIKLTLTRTTQTRRKPGKGRPQHQLELVSGPKVWVWNVFLAFLCGKEWSVPSHSKYENAAKMSLARVVEFPNLYADFEEKDDGWFMIKM